MQSAVAPGITLIQTSRMTYKYKQLSYEPLRLNSIFRETDLSSRHLAHRVPTSSLQTSPGLVDYGKAPRLHDRSAGAVASKKRPRAKSEEGEVSDDAMRSRGSTTQAPNSIVNDGFVFRERYIFHFRYHYRCITPYNPIDSQSRTRTIARALVYCF